MRQKTPVQTLKTLLDLREQGREQEILGNVVRLPVENYTDPEIYERELDTVLRNAPTVAGHACHVQEPGDYLRSEWDTFPYVIVRGREGELWGFLNTCRHRGAKIVSSEKETLNAFVCPYHG